MRSKTVIHNGSIPTLCRQCAHHCGIYVHVKDGRVAKISGNKCHHENLGMVCPKGREIPQWVYHSERLRGCLKRTAKGGFTAIAYDDALDEIARKMLDIRDRSGARAMSAWTGEAIGFLQQEAYAQRFIHAFGSPNFFTADSVCFALRLMAYQTCQGYWSYPPDFERAGMTILWGSNPAYSHPPFMQRINRSRRQGGKLVVVDPRRSVAAKKADLFLQVRPGTDAALALCLIRFLMHEKAYDQEFVRSYSLGFEELATYAEKFSLSYVAQQTGVSEQVLGQMQDLMLQSLPCCVSFAGISLEHQTNGFNTIRAIACLSALCGAIDTKGGEPWNTDILVNHLNPLSDGQFKEMAPAGYAHYPLFYDVMRKCHSLPGIDYMLKEAAYPIEGLIFSGANPVLTNPNANKVVKAFSNLDLLVARDLFMTESAKLAHYIIPTPSGKFEFFSAHLDQLGFSPHLEYKPPDYLADLKPEFPLRMISGTRKAIYYHSRFHEIEKFKRAIPGAQAEIHADDAAQLGIRDGETVRIVSRIGELSIPIKIMESGTILKGFIEIPHGWNDTNVNCLTDDRDVDPVGGFPNLKIVPVRIEKMNVLGG